MKMSKKDRLFSLMDIARISVMAALIAVCSWITVPMPAVPFTLQTFAIVFALEFIGGKNGTVAFIVYALIGAIGVPVFSGFKGGLAHLAGPTGGYLIGFVFTCIIYWAFEKKFTYKSAWHYFVLALGLLACYFCGTAWFVISLKSTVPHALMLCVVPYILPDAVKIAVAVILGVKLKKIIKV